MKKLQIGIVDLVGKGPSGTLWARFMHANLASIMPQVVATWCEQQGHQVHLICYTGREDLRRELPVGVDLVFICAFTHAAQLAYALSNYFRSQGAVTVLGGPHARCYPDDAVHYFDYVLGFTTQDTVAEVLAECAPQRLMGRHLSAGRQPVHLPGVAERWKFIEPTLRKAPLWQVVPMLGSVGCPYTCSFCIDASVPYQPLDHAVIQDDLRFLLTKFNRPIVGWHDPNFGVRFDETLAAIAGAAPPGSFRFWAESSLSLLTEAHLQVLQQHGFEALLPGIESWYELGHKSHTARLAGEAKVTRIAAHVNQILAYVPYVQTNFVLGLDSDAGAEPFELTKRFVDLSPAAFPGYSLLTAFGEAAPLNLEYQRDGRVLPFPFHFLNNHLAMNVKPRHYNWLDFYDQVIDLTAYTFSPRAIYRRFVRARTPAAKWMNVLRAVSSEGCGRLRFSRQVRQQLGKDRAFRRYFEGESTRLPAFYHDIVRQDLGQWWDWLPSGALAHEPNAYLHKTGTTRPAVSAAG